MMTFQQPAFLFGLFLVTIPLIIHLINFRKSKTIYFSSLRFIEEIQTTNRNRRRIQDLLLLILRMLIIALVVFAFARPVIRSSETTTGRSENLTAIIIDNTPSMNLTTNGEVLLALAKEKAKELIESYPPGSRFVLASMDPATASFRITDRNEAISSIEQLTTSFVMKPLNQVIQGIQHQLKQENHELSALIILSDFQQNLINERIPDDSAKTPVSLVRITAESFSNISVDSCWFDNPLHQSGQQENLKARIFNHSNEFMTDFPVRLEINDTLKAEALVDLPPFAPTEVTIPFTNVGQNWQQGIIKLFDYPVTFDNELFFSYRIEPSIPVLLLHEGDPSPDLQRLFGDDSNFSLETFNYRGFPRSDFQEYRLIILDGISQSEPALIQRTRDFLSQGGTVWFFPDLNVSTEQTNSFLNRLSLPTIQGIATYPAESVIGITYQNWLNSVTISRDTRLKMPTIQKMARFDQSAISREDILTTVAGDPVISRYRLPGGSFVMNSISSDPAVSDLMAHPVLVPLTYLVAHMGLDINSLYHNLGSEQPIRIQLNGAGETQLIRIKHLSSELEIIPAQQRSLGDQITLFTGTLSQPGFYSTKADGVEEGLIAFNTPRSESVMECMADSTLEKHFQTTGWKITNQTEIESDGSSAKLSVFNQNKPIWPYLLWLALGLLLVETFVMNRKK
ncbi:MAG: BatA domain-containing protein [Bacteroidales bacterium]|nr:BatA domain-containing protein [Bacteroidales bacterium]